MIEKTVFIELDHILQKELEEVPYRTLSMPLEFTFILILERTRCSLDSLHSLSSFGLVRHDHGIGLIARNILTDFITISYVLAKSDQASERADTLYSLFKSDIKKTRTFLESLVAGGIIEKKALDDFELRSKDEKDLYCHVDNKELTLNTKKFPPFQKIHSWAIENQGVLIINEIIKAYDVWTYYSKYVHLGINSYSLTREINMNLNKLEQRFDRVIGFAITLLCFCSDALGKKEMKSKLIEMASKVPKSCFNEMD